MDDEEIRSLGYRDFGSQAPHTSTKTAAKVLYHYTTVSAFRSIVETNSLWASGAYHLNDASEVEYGVEVITRVARRIREGFQEQAYEHRALKYLLTLLEGSSERRRLNMYVCCFCERDDLLSQWRNYSEGRGVAIGFSFPEMTADASCGLKRIEYDESAQEAIIETTLRGLITATAHIAVLIGGEDQSRDRPSSFAFRAHWSMHMTCWSVWGWVASTEHFAKN